MNINDFSKEDRRQAILFTQSKDYMKINTRMLQKLEQPEMSISQKQFRTINS